MKTAVLYLHLEWLCLVPVLKLLEVNIDSFYIEVGLFLDVFELIEVLVIDIDLRVHKASQLRE